MPLLQQTKIIHLQYLHFFLLLNRSSSQKIVNHCHSKILNTYICKDDENIEYLNLLPYFMNDIVNTLIKHTEENGRGLK